MKFYFLKNICGTKGVFEDNLIQPRMHGQIFIFTPAAATAAHFLF